MIANITEYKVVQGANLRYRGTNKKDSEREFRTWVNFAKNREGNPKVTTITLTKNDNIIKSETIKP